MSRLSEAVILDALTGILDPVSGKSLVAAGLVKSVAIDGGKANVVVQVDPSGGKALEDMRQQAETAVSGLDGVDQATVILTAERQAGYAGAAPTTRTKGRAAPPPGPGPRPAGDAGKKQPLLPEVTHVIAVASGKGGVGKSTTSVNLAVALQRLGLTVGLFDADIFGPSIPRLLGLSGKPQSNDGGKTIEPMEAYGLKAMSIGFLVPEDAATIWRGPMVMGALEQLLRDVNWGKLDVLVIDMPPGTGDTQLTISQRVPLAGAVIVSTPQDIALIDARKGIAMFEKVSVPVIGLIENMSYHICPSCGYRAEIFAHGGARKEAERLGAPFLGEIPLDLKIRETSDGGAPITASEPDGPYAQAYLAIAETVRDGLTVSKRKAPKISLG
ncbi:MAG: Mrp/NBP35 family ATP-binding protein [Alphaproteobacteria bacterium]|nr:Mrp/NBP35 family ATP-binding protein [Alphaproteobacteria bacterium]